METFEQFEALWRKQEERLNSIERVQRDTLRTLLSHNIVRTHRRFRVEGLLTVAVFVVFEVYLLSQASLFVGSWRLALPYVAFNLLYVGINIWSAVWVLRLLRHDPLGTPAVEMMRFADRWHLQLKRSMGWGLGLVVPLAVAVGIPVMARLFGHEFHYSDLQYLAPWRVVAALAVYVAGFAYTLYAMRLTRELKENIRLYDELLQQ